MDEVEARFRRFMEDAHACDRRWFPERGSVRLAEFGYYRDMAVIHDRYYIKPKRKEKKR